MDDQVERAIHSDPFPDDSRKGGISLTSFFLFSLSSPNLLLRKSNHYKTRDRFNVLWDDTKDGCLPEASYRNITDHVNIYIYYIYAFESL